MKFNKLMAMFLAIVMVLGLASVALAEDALKIGVIGPFTGAAAIYGNACKYGAEVAAEQINAQDGLKIELLEEDDEHDAEKSLNAYNTVLDNGAQMIAGTTTTTPCIAVGAQAYEDRVFMLTPSASSPDVTANKDNVFQVCFTDPAQGTASAQYITEHQLGSKVAIIYNNADAYSTGIYNTFVDEAATLGLEIVSTSTFTDETVDFNLYVSDAKDAGADLVFLPIYYQEASLILTQAAGMDYAPVFFGVDGMDGILGVEGFDTTLAEGVLLLTPFVATADDELTKSFVAKYEEKFGETPNQFAADAYDGLYIIKMAAESANLTPDMDTAELCEAMKTAMTEITFNGLTGEQTTWDASGAPTKDPKAMVIQDGIYVAAE